VTLPSTGKSVEYRPYLVKEEKVLMLALESNGQTEMFDAIKNVIRACTFDKIDIDTLCMFDLEFLFLKLRAKSVGETAEISVKCKHCGTPHKVSIDLDKIKIDVPKQEKKIMLTDTIGVVMKYPAVGDLMSAETSGADMSTTFLYQCVDNIFDANKIYKTTESSLEEFGEFIDSLNQKQLEKIKDWLENMPQLKHTIKFTCGNKECGKENEIELRGLQSFFT